MSKCTEIIGKIYDIERLQEQASYLGDKYHYQPGAGKSWQGVPLRNPTASIKRDGIAITRALKGWDEGMRSCKDTPYLEGTSAEYIKEILTDLAEYGEVFLVRLLKLMPGQNIKAHCDGKVFNRDEGKIARFHIPIITDPRIKMFWAEGSQRRPSHMQEVHMRPGQLYYTDVSGLHWVENPTETTRVHLVIDLDRSEAVQRLLKTASLCELVSS